MAEQIVFFKRNYADYLEPGVSATASQGANLANQALNRSNLSAWLTTGSVDADNTTWTVDMTDERMISEILLVKHNFKAFTVKYWDGAAYQNFSPPINETTNTDETSRFSVTPQSTSKIQIRITGTQVPNSDKELYQFIATEMIGQLEGWPVIMNPTMSRNRKSAKMLSGKLNVSENVGSFSCELAVRHWRSEADLEIVEELYSRVEGFLVWLCGGDEAQFFSARQGYRLEDIFLMKCTNEFEPELVQGLYKAGMEIRMKLSEVTG